MEKLFKTIGKIYYFSGDCPNIKDPRQHITSPYFIGNRRLVKFNIAEIPIVALCTLSNSKKLPSKISLDEETVLFVGILYKEGEGEDVRGGYDVVVEGPLNLLLQIIKQDIYLTEEQKDKIIKLKSE